MRGKRDTAAAAVGAAGLIPAHAGKTSSGSRRASGGRAHPRSCGENTPVSTCTISPRGSSPLMRGKPEHAGRNLRRRGLIPAHAGKTRACRAEPTSTRAHPRSRGENPPPLEVPKYAMGSSPLTRGKPGRVHGVTERLGLIPAHAGKTPGHRTTTLSAKAHPRSCGENMAMPRSVRSRTGSSPLTRGKHELNLRSGLTERLIPAQAGKTKFPVSCLVALGAHPRSRGENLRFGGLVPPDDGSSPLTRGKRRPHR